MEKLIVDPMSLYRLPWTMPDNGITWLEPTAPPPDPRATAPAAHGR